MTSPASLNAVRPSPSFCSSVHPPETEAQITLPPFKGESPPGAAVPEEESACTGLPLTTEKEQFAQFAANRIDDHQPLATIFRHSGWKDDRKRVAAAFSRTGQTFNRQSTFEYCGAHSYVLRNVDDPSSYRIAGSCCHDRFCVPCANERSRAIALNVIDFAKDRRLRFLTLTLKATDQTLSEQIDRLLSAFQALRRRKFWTSRCFGGVAFLELNWNDKIGKWHPHLHILIEGNYLPHQALKKLWYHLTGDSWIVDIRAIRDATVATRYVTKYASKPLNNTFLHIPERLDEAIQSLKGRKLCLTFGTWRGLSLSPTPCDGAWEHVASLEAIIEKASHGNTEAMAILQSLSDIDLTPILAQAYQRGPPKPLPIPPIEQLTFFGVWNANGGWNDPE